MAEEYEFWIDVGGTFTDCFLRHPDGSLRRHKLLSSGVTPGVLAAGSGGTQIVDPARAADPPGFWTGYRLRLLAADGKRGAPYSVVDFAAATGTLRLDGDLPPAVGIGQRYELVSDEEAPIVAIRYLLGLPRSATIPPLNVRLGTTRGTNALLTRRGANRAGHHARLCRRVAYRLSKPPALVRSRHRQAGSFDGGRGRDRRARCRRWDAAANGRSGSDSRGAGSAAKRGHRIAGRLPAACLFGAGA